MNRRDLLLPMSLLVVAGSSPVAAQTWRVESKPLIDISATLPDGSIAFSLAMGATRFSSGAVIVADAADSRLILFDSSGRSVSTIGRKGQGPGEFGMVTWLGRCAPDSVFAWDAALQRMTVVSERGLLVRQSRLPEAVQGAFAPYSLTCSRNGILGALGWGKSGQPDSHGIARGAAPLVVFDLTGKVLGKIDQIAFGESVVSNAVGFAPRPLGRRTSIALTNDRLFVGTADSAAVLSYDVRGRILGVFRLPQARRQPTQRHQELAVEPLVAFFPRGEQRDRMRKRLLEIGTPAELPPYSGIFADPAGRIWVQTSFPGDSSTRLQQLAAQGAPPRTLSLRANLTVFEVGVDYVLGKYVDENDNEHVAAYRVSQTPARSR